MSQHKIIVTSCVAVGTGAISALVYNMMSKRRKTVEKSTNDGELGKDSSSCKCPFANVTGVALSGSVLSGALTWFYYPK